MEIRDHRLVLAGDATVPFRETPNQSGEITPEVLVIHFTAGASAESSVNWLVNPDAKASAHLVIGKDGDITQLAAFNRRAWHAGASSWEGRSHVNGFSIGIELDNFGDLVRHPSGWRTSWERPVSDSEVVELPHKFDGKMRGWNAFQEKQLTVALDVAAALAREYELKDVVGHDDIAPGRKWDPGPAFPMNSFRSAVFGREQDEPEVYETTTALNIRSGPGTHHQKLEVSPLPQGTRLDVLREEGVWRLVDILNVVNGEMDVVGWVHGRYIRRVRT